MTDEQAGTGRTRRQLLRGAALVGGVAWTAPVLQAIAPSASADTSLPCAGCLSGGGLLIDGVCKNNKAAAKIVFGMLPICCPGHASMKIMVICQPESTKNNDKVYKCRPSIKPNSIPGFEIYYFEQDGEVGCRKSGQLPGRSSSPTSSTAQGDGSPIITTKNGKSTVTIKGGQSSGQSGGQHGHDEKPCANVFNGTVKDQSNNTLLFEFTDSGDPGKNDIATLTVTSPTGTTLVTGTGSLDRGNLKAHPRLGGMRCDCRC